MNPVEPESIAAWPLAARLADIGLLPNIWRVLVVARGAEESAADDICEEVSSLTDLRVIRRHIRTAQDLIDECARSSEDMLIVSGLADLDEHDWRALDVNRSRLERSAPTLLVVGKQAVGRMPTLAPNLWSWIGDGIWGYDPQDGLDDIAREQRLAELRRHFGLTDEELLLRARAGELPPEPDIAEWLVLLGAGELIPSEVVS